MHDDRAVREYAAAKNRHDPRAALEWCTDDFVLEIVLVTSVFRRTP